MSPPLNAPTPGLGIRPIGVLVAAGCVLLAVGLPVINAGQWAFSSPTELANEHRMSIAPIGKLQAWQRIVGGIASLAPQLLFSWGLLRARGALIAISEGKFFASEVVVGLRGYSLAVLWSAIASVLNDPIISVALTFSNPPGQRALALGLSGTQLLTVVGAGIVWVMVVALAKGAAIAQENEQFV